MRIVRYRDGVVDGMELTFHPRITVLAGVPPTVRARLTETVAALSGTGTLVGEGVVEAHGLLFDLTAENLELLDCASRADVVLRRTDLPGPVDEVGLEDRGSEVAEARRRLDGAEQHYAQAVAAYSDLKRQVESVVEERLSIARQAEAARVDLDSFAEVNLVSAREELASLERVAAELSAGVVAEGAAAMRERAARVDTAPSLRSEREEIRAEIARLEGVDPGPVQRAYSALSLALEPSQVPSREGIDLAERLAAARADLERRQRFASRDRALAEAIGEVNRAEQGLLAAQRAAATPPLAPDVVEHLESNRDEFVALTRTRGRHLGKGRRIAQCEEVERELLDRLGFDCWGDYILGTSRTGSARARHADLLRAHTRLDRARAEARRVGEEAEKAPELEQARTRLRSLEEQARRLLGRPATGDLVGALRGLTVTVSLTDSEQEQATAELIRCLERVGVRVSQTAPRAVLAQGRVWLESMEHRDRRLGELADSEAELLRRLAAAEQAIVPEDGPGRRYRPDLAIEAQQRMAWDRVRQMQRRLAGHEAALEGLALLRSREESLTARERDLRMRLVGQERSVEHVAEIRRECQKVVSDLLGATGDSRPPRGGGQDPGAAEWYVLTRLAQLRGGAPAGSLPLVIDDAFSGRDHDTVRGVLARIDRMSEVIQIVYLSDDPEIVEWALGLGSKRAAVVDLGLVGGRI